MEGIHVVGYQTRGLGEGSPSVGSRGKALIGSLGTNPPETEAKCEISVQCFHLWKKVLGLQRIALTSISLYDPLGSVASNEQ